MPEQVGDQALFALSELRDRAPEGDARDVRDRQIGSHMIDEEDVTDHESTMGMISE